MFADIKSNWPIVIFTLNGLGQRLPLRMALDAGIAGIHIIKSRRIENVVALRLLDVGLARSVAFLATYIPLGGRFRVDVVIHRMAAVAKRPGRSLEIVWR